MNDLKAHRLKKLHRRSAAMQSEIERLWASIGRPRAPLRIVKPERTNR